MKSDIWSLGITMVTAGEPSAAVLQRDLAAGSPPSPSSSSSPSPSSTPSPSLLFLSSLQIELAILRFPYDSWGTPFQQLKQVVEEPSPQLPADQFSPDFVDFTSQWCGFSLHLHQGCIM